MYLYHKNIFLTSKTYFKFKIICTCYFTRYYTVNQKLRNLYTSLKFILYYPYLVEPIHEKLHEVYLNS